MKKFTKLAALALAALTSVSASSVNFKINVDNPESVKLTVSDGGNTYTAELVAGDNSFDLGEYAYLQAEGVSPCVIESVTNQAGTPESIYSGCWYKTVYSSDEGATYTIVTKNLDEARTASCTVNVDDASRVYATLSGTNSVVSLVNGENTLRFDPENETTLRVSAANYNYPNYSVSVNGEPVEDYYGSYNVPLVQGCNVDITALVPDKDITLTIAYADEASVGAIGTITVEGVQVTPVDNVVNLKAGQRIGIKDDSMYAIESVDINGNPTNWTGSYEYTWTAMDDCVLNVKAHKYSTLSVKVTVNDPDQIILYRGYSYQEDVIKLNEGENTIEVPENNSYISWRVATGCYLVSATINGESATSDGVYATDNMEIVFETAAITMDKTAVVWTDFDPQALTYFSFTTYTREEIGKTFTEGYNVVPFYDAYTPFMLSWYTADLSVNKVYVNDVLKAPQYDGGTSYELLLEDKDVVKIFLTAEPEECAVTFQVDEDAAAYVTRDIIRPVDDLTQPLTVLAGTQFNITYDGDAIEVSVNDTPVTAADDAGFQFVVTEPAIVKITTPASSGISSVETEANATRIFNLQGICVGNSLDALPAGIYIRGGKKLVVK